MGYGPERATTAAVGFLQGIHPAVTAAAAAGASRNPSADDADANTDSARANAHTHELQPPKASRALFELKSEPEPAAAASPNGAHSSTTAAATAAAAATSAPPPARVLKDVVCFHAASYRQVSELLQLDLHEPPASQVRALLENF